MLRHKRRTAPDLRMSLLYAVRTPVDVIYADELGDDALITFTREAPPGWTGHTGRIDAAMVAAAGDGGGRAYVCGSSGFVETVTRLLLAAGFEPGNVRTERFGPTG